MPRQAAEGPSSLPEGGQNLESLYEVAVKIQRGQPGVWRTTPRTRLLNRGFYPAPSACGPTQDPGFMIVRHT